MTNLTVTEKHEFEKPIEVYSIKNLITFGL